MSTPERAKTASAHFADVVERLGSISLSRIAAYPAPGAATERDLLVRHNGGDQLYELVDGVLVEKVSN